jgi:5'(3')-deoxyribonucleotidase
LDGVLADIVAQLVAFAREKYGIDLQREQIVSEHAHTCTPLSIEQLESLFRDRGFFSGMPPMLDACAALRDIQGLGFEVDIVTDRFWYSEIADDTKQWLAKHEIPFSKLIFARRGEKQLVAAERGHRLFIEDQAANARIISSVTAVYLLDRPYNRALRPSERVHRVASMEEILKELRAAGHQEPYLSARPTTLSAE